MFFLKLNNDEKDFLLQILTTEKIDLSHTIELSKKYGDLSINVILQNRLECLKNLIERVKSLC